MLKWAKVDKVVCKECGKSFRGKNQYNWIQEHNKHIHPNGLHRYDLHSKELNRLEKKKKGKKK